MAYGAYSLSEWVVIVCSTACLVVYGLHISAGVQTKLCRWRELFPKTANDEMRSQLGRQMIGEWRSQHLKFALPFVQLFWALFSFVGLFNTIAGISRANNLYQDVCIWVGFFSTCSTRAGLAQRSRLRFTQSCESTCWYAVHVISFMCIVLAADSWGDFHFYQVATIIPRLVINIIYFRSWIASCCTAFHSVLQVVILLGDDAHFRSPQSESTRLYVSIEVVTAVFLIVGNAAWEIFVHRQIHTEIEKATTQSEATASRRLLNTICDATFELDANLSITGEAAQLAGMLQLGSNRCLRGIMVESFVLQQDRERFRERISAPVPDHQEMANVFRICLCDSLSNVITVEVYHVPVHGPSAATRHLVGVKELVDFRDTVDRELPVASSSHQLSQISSRHSKRSRRSGSRRDSALASFGHLEDPLGPGLPGGRRQRQGTPPATAANAGFFTDLRHDYNPFAVKFYADSMDVLDATGDGAEACVPGSCFRSIVQPEQDLFMDIQMGCYALRDMLLSDQSAQFRFRTTVDFSRGAIHKALCEVTLMVEDVARIRSECTEILPIVATLQVVGSMPRTPTSSQVSDFGSESNSTNSRTDSSSQDSC